MTVQPQLRQQHVCVIYYVEVEPASQLAFVEISFSTPSYRFVDLPFDIQLVKVQITVKICNGPQGLDLRSAKVVTNYHLPKENDIVGLVSQVRHHRSV